MNNNRPGKRRRRLIDVVPTGRAKVEFPQVFLRALIQRFDPDDVGLSWEELAMLCIADWDGKPVAMRPELEPRKKRERVFNPDDDITGLKTLAVRYGRW